MAIPRAYSAAIHGTDGIGSSGDTRVVYGEIRVASAQDIDCVACGASVGEPCTSGRMSGGKHPVPLLCQDRLELAKMLKESGDLGGRHRAACPLPLSR